MARGSAAIRAAGTRDRGTRVWGDTPGGVKSCPEDRGVWRLSVRGSAGAVPAGCPRPVVARRVPAFERPSRVASRSVLLAAEPGEGASGVPGAFRSGSSTSLDGCFSSLRDLRAVPALQDGAAVEAAKDAEL